MPVSGDLAIWASRGRESAGVCVLWAFSGMQPHTRALPQLGPSIRRRQQWECAVRRHIWNAEKGVFFRADLGLESPSYVCSLLSVRLGPQCCFTAQHAATALPTAAPVR